MSAIGPGDWVECIKVAPPEPRGYGYGFRVGTLYFVRQVRCPDGLWFTNAPDHDSGRPWSADHFRPIYRPKSELIETLLRKADEPVKEDA